MKIILTAVLYITIIPSSFATPLPVDQLVFISGVGGQGEGNSLAVVDAATHKIIKTLKFSELGHSSKNMVFSADGSKLFLVQYSGAPGAVIVIDTSTLEIEKTIQAGNGASSAVLSKDGAKLFVMNHRGNSVSVIDTATLEKIDDVKTNMLPQDIALSRDGTKLLINYGPPSYEYDEGIDVDSLKKFDVNEWADTIYFENRPSISDIDFALFNDDRSKLFLLDRREGFLKVIDAEKKTQITSASVGNNPVFATLDRDGGKLFVVNEDGKFVSVLDTNTYQKIVADIPTGNEPSLAALNIPQNKLFVIGNTYQKFKSHWSMSVIDVNTYKKIDTFEVPFFPRAILTYRPTISEQLTEHMNDLIAGKNTTDIVEKIVHDKRMTHELYADWLNELYLKDRNLLIAAAKNIMRSSALKSSDYLEILKKLNDKKITALFGAIWHLAENLKVLNDDDGIALENYITGQSNSR